MNLPIEIYNIVNGLSYKIDNVGRSNDIIIIYGDKYLLKISNNVENLKKEKDKIDFLYNEISSAKSILFIVNENIAYYLRTYIVGKTLIDDEYLSNPILLISLLKKALFLLNNIKDCPFNSDYSIGIDFIHGDLCLPNIIVDENNEIAGFIDLSDSGLGDRWYDIAWLIWSFEYNLKTDKYTSLLLKELDIEFDENKFNEYIPIEHRIKIKK